MANPSKTARKKAWQWGRYAEALAVARLRSCGYGIVAKRYRTAVGEIDLIAERGSTIIFIEVKARQNISDGLASITYRQQQRIICDSQWFLQNSLNSAIIKSVLTQSLLRLGAAHGM
jgi:putative endonuclease